MIGLRLMCSSSTTGTAFYWQWGLELDWAPFPHGYGSRCMHCTAVKYCTISHYTIFASLTSVHCTIKQYSAINISNNISLTPIQYFSIRLIQLLMYTCWISKPYPNITGQLCLTISLWLGVTWVPVQADTSYLLAPYPHKMVTDRNLKK